MSNTRRGTLTVRAFSRGGVCVWGGSQGPGFLARKEGHRAGWGGRQGEREASRVYAASLTFSTNADFKHPGAEAVAGWHAEAFVGGIFFGAHEHVIRGRKAVRLDAFHLDVLHVGKMDGPDENLRGWGERKKNRLCFRSANFTMNEMNEKMITPQVRLGHNWIKWGPPLKSKTSIRCNLICKVRVVLLPFLIDRLVHTWLISCKRECVLCTTSHQDEFPANHFCFSYTRGSDVHTGRDPRRRCRGAPSCLSEGGRRRRRCHWSCCFVSRTTMTSPYCCR